MTLKNTKSNVVNSGMDLDDAKEMAGFDPIVYTKSTYKGMNRRCAKRSKSINDLSNASLAHQMNHHQPQLTSITQCSNSNTATATATATADFNILNDIEHNPEPATANTEYDATDFGNHENTHEYEPFVHRDDVVRYIMQNNVLTSDSWDAIEMAKKLDIQLPNEDTRQNCNRRIKMIQHLSQVMEDSFKIIKLFHELIPPVPGEKTVTFSIEDSPNDNNDASSETSITSELPNEIFDESICNDNAINSDDAHDDASSETSIATNESHNENDDFDVDYDNLDRFNNNESQGEFDKSAFCWDNPVYGNDENSTMDEEDNEYWYERIISRSMKKLKIKTATIENAELLAEGAQIQLPNDPSLRFRKIIHIASLISREINGPNAQKINPMRLLFTSKKLKDPRNVIANAMSNLHIKQHNSVNVREILQYLRIDLPEEKNKKTAIIKKVAMQINWIRVTYVNDIKKGNKAFTYDFSKQELLKFLSKNNVEKASIATSREIAEHFGIMLSNNEEMLTNQLRQLSALTYRTVRVFTLPKFSIQLTINWSLTSIHFQ